MPDAQTLARWARKAIARPPRETMRKAQRIVRDGVEQRRQRHKAATNPTFMVDRSVGVLRPLLNRFELADLNIDRTWLAAACSRAIVHEFDLLGSGPVVVRHGTTCPGIESYRYRPTPAVTPEPSGAWLDGRINRANLEESRQIWALVDPDYMPIDWQLDFRSGWRWSERTWFRDVAIGVHPGADVKLPWELSRLQHLPQLAIAAAIAADGGASLGDAGALTREIRNEILDFVATNPPRFGANWVTAMDVAIRVSNLILAHDILLSRGIAFDEPAETVFRRSVLEHAAHISANLEWDPVNRGNHYLADLVGLIFAAAALEAEPEAASWLDSATDQLESEISLQFNPDGSNVEGSIAYHGLSAEMSIYGIAVVAGSHRARGKLPSDIGDLISSILWFSRAMTGPDGQVVQIGDNDSGRFVALDGGRDSLDHERVADAAAGLTIGAEDASDAAIGISQAVVRALAHGTKIGIPGRREMPDGVEVGDASTVEAMSIRIAALGDRSRAIYRIPMARLTTPPVLAGFPDGGFWAARAPGFQLVIRCGPIGQNGHGGHDHDDQLSFDLWLGNRHVVADPGTYVYTPLPTARNRYRSSANHAGPYLAGPEPVGLEAGLFTLDHAAAGICLAWGPWGFSGTRTDRFGRTALALITWSGEALEVQHGVERGELHPSRLTGDWRCLLPDVLYSPGYGRST